VDLFGIALNGAILVIEFKTGRQNRRHRGHMDTGT